VREAVVVADPSIASGANFVAGANRSGYHLRNVNFPRDFEADIVADIAEAYEGAPCGQCGAPLRAVRAIEVGHLFKLGTRYSEAVGATFRDADGEEHPVVMGSYGIGLGRLMAVIVEQHHDDRGIVWPPSVAPYDVHLVGLNLDDETVQAAAESTYRTLMDAGLAVLYDDRRESPGVKFSDADLVGVPVRLTVSQRSLAQGGVEVKRRAEPKAAVVPREELMARLQDTYLAVPGGEYEVL
jgi:prolyl-tRNA synthetase